MKKKQKMLKLRGMLLSLVDVGRGIAQQDMKRAEADERIASLLDVQDAIIQDIIDYVTTGEMVKPIEH